MYSSFVNIPIHCDGWCRGLQFVLRNETIVAKKIRREQHYIFYSHHPVNRE